MILLRICIAAILSWSFMTLNLNVSDKFDELTILGSRDAGCFRVAIGAPPEIVTFERRNAGVSIFALIDVQGGGVEVGDRNGKRWQCGSVSAQEQCHHIHYRPSQFIHFPALWELPSCLLQTKPYSEF